MIIVFSVLISENLQRIRIALKTLVVGRTQSSFGDRTSASRL